jgi:hypothetical protein
MATHDVAPATPALVAHGRTASHDLLLAGGVVGLLAGAAMLATIAVSAGLADVSPARPLLLTAATLLDRVALEGGASAALVGLLLWAAVSVVLALVFGALLPRDFPFVCAAVLGVGYMFFAIAFATSLFLPRLNPLMRDEMPAMGGAWVIAYTVFGVVLGVVPLLRRRFSASR